MIGDGKVRLCLNVPAEVYQLVYERSQAVGRPMCEIVVRAVCDSAAEQGWDLRLLTASPNRSNDELMTEV